jgi:hypothetical protein
VVIRARGLSPRRWIDEVNYPIEATGGWGVQQSNRIVSDIDRADESDVTQDLFADVVCLGVKVGGIQPGPVERHDLGVSTGGDLDGSSDREVGGRDEGWVVGLQQLGGPIE